MPSGALAPVETSVCRASPCGILGGTMAEESTTPDLVALTRRQFDAVNRRDMDAAMSRFPPDGVYDTSPDGLDVLDLGHGIVFSLVRQTARPAKGTGHLQRREAYVLEWVEDLIRRTTVYTDIDEGRAAAERLAEERG
jgi:hypothetical protein